MAESGASRQRSSEKKSSEGAKSGEGAKYNAVQAAACSVGAAAAICHPSLP